MWTLTTALAGSLAIALAATARAISLAIALAARPPPLARTRGAFRHEIIDDIAIAVRNDQPLTHLCQNGRQLFLIDHCTDGQGFALTPGTPGSANTMDIGINGFRKIEIDHQTQAGHIDPACRHIGGNQHL